MSEETYPSLEKTEWIHRGFCDVRIDTLRKKDGSSLNYAVLSTKRDAVAILAQDEKGRFLLNREYRHPTGNYLLSCPGGRMEEGEDPKDAAARELLEETGYAAEKLSLLHAYYPLPSLCDQKIYLFTARSLVKAKKQSLDPFEFIQPVFLSKEELLREMSSSSSVDGTLAAALFYWGLHLSA